MASALLASKLEFEHTKNSYKLDTPQGSQEERILVMAQARLGNPVVPEVQVVVVEDCEVLKQPLHPLDLFEVGLILFVVVVNPFYKKNQMFNAQK